MKLHPVGILGATGMVGQQFIRQLAGHPWFRVAWLGASGRSEGRSYAEAASWRLSMPMPDDIARMRVDLMKRLGVSIDIAGHCELPLPD